MGRVAEWLPNPKLATTQSEYSKRPPLGASSCLAERFASFRSFVFTNVFRCVCTSTANTVVTMAANSDEKTTAV